MSSPVLHVHVTWTCSHAHVCYPIVYIDINGVINQVPFSVNISSYPVCTVIMLTVFAPLFGQNPGKFTVNIIIIHKS